MNIDTAFYKRSIATLEKAHGLLMKTDASLIEYDMYRSACIKEFELILEQSGKLLKKVLKPYFPTAKAADKLVFKDIFRHAVLHAIINDDESERWMQYRDNRNNTAHDYGVHFAEDTLVLLPQFITDAKSLAASIDKQCEENNAAS